jgi:hypothetical protein
MSPRPLAEDMYNHCPTPINKRDLGVIRVSIYKRSQPKAIRDNALCNMGIEGFIRRRERGFNVKKTAICAPNKEQKQRNYLASLAGKLR